MSEFLAEAEVLIRPNTAAFRATLVAELAAATKGLVVPVNVVAAGSGRAAGSVQQVAVAQREVATATKVATVATEQQVSVQRIAAATAAAEAKAQRGAAAAARESAVAHEALARGAGATALSELGVRGATLAASGPFLAGAAAVTILFKSIKEASAEAEAAARAEKIFGDRTRQLEKDAAGFAKTLGLSVTQTLAFEGALGNVLTVAGVAHDRIPKLSEDLVKLGADVAAFNNVPVADVLKTFQLGILGNTRGLKSLGIELSAASVNQRALAESGKKTTAELTTQDRELARISLLFDRTTNQQGAAEARSHSLAGETRTLTANLANFGATVGKVVIPVVTGLTYDLNLLFDGFHKAGQGLGFLGTTLGNWAADLVEKIPGGEHAMEALGNAANNAAKGTDTLDKSAGKAGQSLAELAAIANRLQFKNAETALSSLSEHLLDLQFKGASPGQIIANLQGQIGAAQQEIANAPTVAARVRAREKRNQLKDQIDSIVAQQEADAKKLADDAQKGVETILAVMQRAADLVKQKLEEARQALLDSFSLEQGGNDLQTTRAENTKSLVDDLAALQARRLILQREISVAKAANLDALTVLNLQIQLAQTRNQISTVEAQQAANRQQRKQATFDRAAESVDLDIQLAQTNKNLRAEIAARQRRIKLDLEREKAVRGDILATKRLRNDIAEQRAAIADLRKQLGQRNKDFQALSFEFLQTQSGFAATLISNLIPGSATAGLVGGSTSGAISTPTLSPERSRPPDVGAGLGSAAQTSGPKGATTGQMSMLIEIQRRTLQVLTRLAGEQTHPEAKNQKIAQAVSMDIINW